MLLNGLPIQYTSQGLRDWLTPPCLAKADRIIFPTQSTRRMVYCTSNLRYSTHDTITYEAQSTESQTHESNRLLALSTRHVLSSERNTERDGLLSTDLAVGPTTTASERLVSGAKELKSHEHVQ